MANQPTPYPIIDSHIHLYPTTELDQLSWCTPSNPLATQHSIEEYDTATGTPSNLEGFIFLEVDRKFDLESGLKDGSGWEMPLDEVDWLSRIAGDNPREGEGHKVGDGKKCLAIIPWAPLPSGEEAMKAYVRKVRERAGEEVFKKIKGFRYLVQDKPRGVMLGEGFIEGLKWMGREGFVFDLGVDLHSGGKWQLEEAVEMVQKSHEGVEEKDRVVFIINHLCKPDLSIYNETDPSFIAWRTAMSRLAKQSNTHMKLSGCFEEMPVTLRNAPVLDIFVALQPYLAVVLGAFGAHRIMFASNWPVCTIDIPGGRGGAKGGDDGDYGGYGGAWKKWKAVVEKFCYLASLSVEDQIMIWSGTAIKAYNLKELI